MIIKTVLVLFQNESFDVSRFKEANAMTSLPPSNVSIIYMCLTLP